MIYLRILAHYEIKSLFIPLHFHPFSHKFFKKILKHLRTHMTDSVYKKTFGVNVLSAKTNLIYS